VGWFAKERGESTKKFGKKLLASMFLFQITYNLFCIDFIFREN
jgi:hypothetical protein